MGTTVDENPGPSQRIVALSDSTLLTYRYLRAGIVAMAVFLALSVGFAIAAADGPLRGSISSYYYTSVRSVFVGTLVAIGLALIAIRGKGWEETLLNLAGMLAPVVALVPTRTKPVPPNECPDGAITCVPTELLPGIENNMRALVFVGVLILVFAWLTALRSRGREQVGGPSILIGLLAASIVALSFGLWVFVAPVSFISAGHNAAAITMFACIIAVVIINARRVAYKVADRVRGLTPSQFRWWYAAVAGAMIATLGTAAGFLLVAWRTDASSPRTWIFFVEASLLLFFTLFWVLQSMEYWEEGIPDGGDPLTD